MLETKLRELIKQAMLAKSKEANIENVTRYVTLKNILETAQKAAKEKKIDVTDSMIIDAAKKEIKQLKELLEYCKDNKEKTLETNIAIDVAGELLPTMATETEIQDFVNSHKADANNIGAMMKLLKAEFGDSLDGKMASQIVKNLL